jgi:hypothetical protein
VATLLNGEQAAGYHEVKFDGSELSSGVYFYRIRAGSFTQTKKLLLLRRAPPFIQVMKTALRSGPFLFQFNFAFAMNIFVIFRAVRPHSLRLSRDNGRGRSVR